MTERKHSARFSVGKHEIYCCGAKVRIENGKIEVLSDPLIEYCPLHAALYGTDKIDVEAVRRSVEMKISQFGFCSENRVFDDSMVVPYGSSEIIRVCMEKKLLDCAVTVCDGAGTVISWNPSLVQAVGARLNGILKTSPIKSTIRYIKENDGVVLDEGSAKISQAEGVLKACQLGFKRIAVTVASFYSDEILKIRKIERENGIKVAIFSVCNTCASREDVEKILAGADVVCAGASRLIREVVGSKALMQLGVTIPVFVLTSLGKSLVLAYLEWFRDSLVIFRTRKLPYKVEGREPRVKQ